MKARKTMVGALTLAAALAACADDAKQIYELNSSVTDGLDLTAMPGYYADRMYGPKDQDVSFAGPLTVDDSVSVENPFTIYGCGQERSIQSVAGSGIISKPLRLVAAPGVTTTSYLNLYNDTFFYMPSLDIGAYSTVQLGYQSDGNLRFSGLTKLDIHDGGILKNYGMALGQDVTNVEVRVTNGGLISAEYVILCNQTTALDAQPKAHMVISNATVSTSNAKPGEGKCFNMMGGVAQYDANVENCRVEIQNDGVLQAAVISHSGGGRSNVIFDGGRYLSPTETTQPLFFVAGNSYGGGYPNPRIYLHGVNGHPIDITIDHDRNFAGGWSDGRLICLTGTGGFTKRGNGVLRFNRHNASTCDYTGPTDILGGGIVVTNATYKPGRGALTVAEGCFLDLNGFACTFASASGAGVVTNGAAGAATLELGYGDATGAFELATVGAAVNLVKTGAGVLTVGGAALQNTGDFTINAGTVKFGGDSLSYGAVVVADGATLDISGVAFTCANLVLKSANAKLLTDAATRLVIASAADQSFNNGLTGLTGDFAKAGAGKMTIYGADTLNGHITVGEGILKVMPGKWSGKYIKLNMQKGASSDGNQWHKGLGEFALYDAAGSNVALSVTALSATQGDTGTGLAEGEMRQGRHNSSQGWYDYPAGCGPLNLFDGDVTTITDLQSSWGSEFFIVHLPSTSGDLVGYNFNSGKASKWYRLVTWKLYGSDNGTTWTLLGDHLCKDWSNMDERNKTMAEVPEADCTWYNDGVPYCFAAYSNTTGRAFGESAVVSVAPGATLDLCNVGIQLGGLAVDCTAGAGTITRFTPAANGVVELTNVSDLATLEAGYDLPLTVGQIAANAKQLLKTWRVTVNGDANNRLRVTYKFGKLHVSLPPGLTVLVR